MRQQTTVDWFCNRRGYGYLRSPDDGPDLWVHFSDVRPGESGYKTLAADQLVEYTPALGDKGPKAVEVFPVEEEVMA